MKRSQVLAVAVVALFLLAALPAHVVQAQSSYTEKLNVYVAGDSALWYITFTGLNDSSQLSGLQSSQGLRWYNITAIDTTRWPSDFQVFGPSGYGLLPVPFIPTQGLFLTLGSDSYNDASASAATLDSYFMTSFTSYSNDTANGVYAFFSPLSFSSVIPSTLMKFVPTSENGFSKLITTSTFVSTSSPFVVLEGVPAGSGFDRTLVVGSIASSALDTSGRPTVRAYFQSNPASIQAAKLSSSSVVQITVLDGIIQSSDHASVTRGTALFTGSYTLDMAPGTAVSQFNATVVQDPAPLLATRAVDQGVLNTNSNLAVTLSLKNISPHYGITNVTFADNWWSGNSAFTFLSGNYSISGKALATGSVDTLVYLLHYTGTGSGSVTIPASVVRYQYQAHGVTFSASTALNPIRLSLGVDDAVVYAILTPNSGIGKAVGDVQTFNLTLVNVGTLPASSVVAGGVSVSGLAAKSSGAAGSSATVVVSQRATGLTGINTTRTYGVTYQDPGGSTYSTSTNLVTNYFSHTGMAVGFPVLKVTTSVSPISSSRTNLTLTFTTSDVSSRNVTDFVATGTIPPGLGCGSVSGTGLTCSGGVVSISYSYLDSSAAQTASMRYTLTSLANYIVPPLSFQATTAGSTFHGKSNAASVPAGLSLSKQFSPSMLFGGMGSQAKASLANAGPSAFYNVTLSTTRDSFDTIPTTTALTESSPSVSAGKNSSFPYGVTVTDIYGTVTSTPVTAKFVYGGTYFTVSGGAAKVVVYMPLNVSITTSPTNPVEGKSFAINFKISNPSPLQVTDVHFTLPVPSGLGLSNLNGAQVSSGVLTIDAGTLGPQGTVTASADAVASSGIVVPFAKAALTFSYGGKTISGSVPSKTGIAIAENVTTRYLIPTALVLLALLATAFYVRRKASTVPSSQK